MQVPLIQLWRVGLINYGFHDSDGHRLRLTKLGIQNATLHTWRQALAGHLAMLTGNLRAVVNKLPSPHLGTNLDTTAGFAGTLDGASC